MVTLPLLAVAAIAAGSSSSYTILGRLSGLVAVNVLFETLFKRPRLLLLLPTTEDMDSDLWVPPLSGEGFLSTDVIVEGGAG